MLKETKPNRNFLKRYANVYILFISLMLLVSFASALQISGDSGGAGTGNDSLDPNKTSSYYFFKNTTSDSSGDYAFTNIPNGKYLVEAVQYSTARSGMWLTNVSEITVKNGTKLEGLDLSMKNNTDIDHRAILGLFDRTTISGKTISRTGANKTYVDVVLTTPESEFLANTTSDEFGNYRFSEVRNGKYLVEAVQYSPAASGMWLTNVSEITVENGTKLEGFNLPMRKNDTIDHQAILGLLDRTTISGKTISRTGANKTYVDIALLKKSNVKISNAPHLNISIITGYTTYDVGLTKFAERVNSDPELNITVNVYITTQAPEEIDLSHTDLIYIVTVTQSASKFETAVREAIDNGSLVIGSN
ncbi:MAG: carboxypeptidase-like regulatory domain-containing protein, partial [Methanosarcinaceae archaeon]|nr:carboxypeptidase-like regulatory domain-containing protein [Methanosarcinaceae archaeon]